MTGSATPSLTLTWLPGRYAVCRLAPDAAIPSWANRAAGFTSITRTDEELSIVADDSVVPTDITAELDWVALRVVGPLDFSLIGVLAALSSTLAKQQVSVFAISTYDTDYLLVKRADAQQADAALRTVASLQGKPPRE